MFNSRIKIVTNDDCEHMSQEAAENHVINTLRYNIKLLLSSSEVSISDNQQNAILDQFCGDLKKATKIYKMYKEMLGEK